MEDVSDCCKLRVERQGGLVSTQWLSHAVSTQRLIGELTSESSLASEVCVFTGRGGELQPHPGSFLSLLTQQSGCFPDVKNQITL